MSNFAWDYLPLNALGHDPNRAVYRLHAVAPTADDAKKLLVNTHIPAFLAVERDGATIKLSSGGEDALDELADTATDLDGHRWQFLPPTIDGVELIEVDGYWILPSAEPTFVARREAIAAQLCDALAGYFPRGLHWGCDDGVLVLRGTARVGVEYHFFVGPPQLDLLEQALADGSISDYVLDESATEDIISPSCGS